MVPRPRSSQRQRQAVIRVGLDDAALRGELLGKRLNELRDAKGLTLAQLSRLAHRRAATISRWETGRHVPQPPELYFLLERLGVSARERDELMALADEAREPASEVVSAVAADYGWLEGRSTSIADWQDVAVPGLLQTPDYARAILRAWDPDAPPERIEHVLQARLDRQRRLEGDQPLQVSAIVGEVALRFPVGGREAMRAQLRHLIDCANLPNVELRVAPTERGAHAGFAGPFTILRSTERAYVWVSTRGGPVLFEDAEPFERTFRHIWDIALPHRKTVAMIAAMFRETA